MWRVNTDKAWASNTSSDKGLMLRTTTMKLFMNFYDTQFTLLTPLINQNYLAILPHPYNTTVSLETYPFILLSLTCNYPQLGQPLNEQYCITHYHVTYSVIIEFGSSLIVDTMPGLFCCKPGCLKRRKNKISRE